MKAGDERSTFVCANRQFSTKPANTYVFPVISSLHPKSNASAFAGYQSPSPPPPTKPNSMILVREISQFFMQRKTNQGDKIRSLV